MKVDDGGSPPESSHSISSHTDQTALKTYGRGPSVPTSQLSRLNLISTQRGDFPDSTVVKNPPANAGDTGSSPGPGRSHMPQSN